MRTVKGSLNQLNEVIQFCKHFKSLLVHLIRTIRELLPQEITSGILSVVDPNLGMPIYRKVLCDKLQNVNLEI